MRARLLFFGCLVALIGCSATSAAPLPEALVDQSAVSTDVIAAATPIGASSAMGADDLVQLLTAPVPIAMPVLAPDAPPPKPSGPPYKSGPRADSPVITPPAALPEGDGTVYAVGDSVLLGAQPYLATTLGGWDLRIDARVGRTFPEGLELIHENRANIGQAAIVLLGHNYWSGRQVYSYLDQMMADLRNVERVVVVTVAEFSPQQVEVNKAIHALTRTYPNVVIADWAAVAAANPQFLIADRVHPTGSGAVALANLLAVMLGPARPNGRVVPPPKILQIPEDQAPASTSATPPRAATTTTTGPPSSTTSTTSTTVVTTTTSIAPPATTTTTTP